MLRDNDGDDESKSYVHPLLQPHRRSGLATLTSVGAIP